MRRESDERITLALQNLRSVVDNKMVPRNIKRVAQDCIAVLRSSELSLPVRAANAVSILEEITSDYNIPSFARVTLWQAVANLEGIKE